MMDKEKILERVKTTISISCFQEEEKLVKKSNKNILKVSAIACCLMVTVAGGVFAKDIIVKKFGYNSSKGVENAVNNGYVAEVNSEFQEYDGIGISVDSFIMDNENFDMNFRVKFSEEYNINDMKFGMDLYDLKVIDENENIIFATNELQTEEIKQKYKTEEEAKANYNIYSGAYSMNSDDEIINGNELMYHLTATSSGSNFPKSKKLYVTCSRIHVRKNENEQPLNDWYYGDWKFEVDVPEQFYNRKSTEYKVKSCNNEKIDINKIETSINKTSFKIYIPEMLLTDEVDYDLYRSYDVKEISDKMLLQKEYVETSDGKRFEVSQNGTNEYGVPEGENKIINYTQTFDLTTFDTTDEISVHIFTNKGKEIIIKLAQ